MLEKNKDYLEMRVASTDCAFTQNEWAQVRVDGYVYTTYMNIPDPGELYVFISKEKFEQLKTENEQLKKKLHEFDPISDYKEMLEKLYSKEDVEKLEWTLNHICGGQASVNGWRASSKFWNGRYKDLLKLVGFSSKKEVEDYLVNEAECDTLHDAILKLKDQVKYTCDEWCSANSSNNSWKAAAECNSPKELIEKREALDKEIEVYSRALNEWKEGTGCPSPSAAKSLIESGASWHHAYRDVKAANEKLADDVKSWKNVTGYSTPEDYMHARLNLAWRDVTGELICGRDLRHTLQVDLEYYRTLSASQAKYIYGWKEATGCPTPEEAKTLIESGMAYEHGYHEAQEENRKLTEEVDSWKNVTGYSTPEDYMHARISGAFHTPFDYTAAWQKATGCNTPEQAKERIKALNERIDESEACYNHLLNLTGFESEGEIEDALDKCDHSTLRKALVDYEFDYEALLKLTGYKSEQDIRVALNYSEQFVYETMRELINSLKRNAKFTESNWQHATGCDTPGMAEEKLEYYKKRLGNAVQAASCATKHLENITF